MALSKRGLQRLKDDEGFRLTMYKCTAGKCTVGWGHNLDTPISQAAADMILADDIKHVEQALSQYDWYKRLCTPSNRARQDAIINLAFNVGIAGLLNFKRMIRALSDPRRTRYDIAAYELLDSKYAYQVQARAIRLAHMLRTGEYVDG